MSTLLFKLHFVNNYCISISPNAPTEIIELCHLYLYGFPDAWDQNFGKGSSYGRIKGLQIDKNVVGLILSSPFSSFYDSNIYAYHHAFGTNLIEKGQIFIWRFRFLHLYSYETKYKYHYHRRLPSYHLNDSPDDTIIGIVEDNQDMMDKISDSTFCAPSRRRRQYTHFANSEFCNGYGISVINKKSFYETNEKDVIHTKEWRDSLRQHHILEMTLDLSDINNTEPKEQTNPQNLKEEWVIGTELLGNKYGILDGCEIEYDSDPDQKDRNRIHKHKGRIISIRRDKHSVLIDYTSYNCNDIKVKLKPIIDKSANDVNTNNALTFKIGNDIIHQIKNIKCKENQRYKMVVAIKGFNVLALDPISDDPDVVSEHESKYMESHMDESDDRKYRQYYQDECIVRHDKSSWCGEQWHSCHMRWWNNWTNNGPKIDSTVNRQSWQGDTQATVDSVQGSVGIVHLK